MRRVGLTGGLASGKSTVAGLFRDLGAFHVDADKIAHALLAPGGRAYDAVVARFGPRILSPDGTIDRKALARVVFADKETLAALNAITHPMIREEIAWAIQDHAERPNPSPVALVDAALLVESGIHRDLDALIVADCRPETQVQRAVARGGMTVGEARARIAAQTSREARRKAADYVIDTDGTLAQSAAQVRAVWDALRAGR